ncbi:hypothetical protein DDN60_12870 [Vibrio cholerae]|nr:hypothetical protein [Vibrio cholerae]
MPLKNFRLLFLIVVFVAADSVNSLSAQANESIDSLNQNRVCLIQDAYKAGTTCNEGEIMLFHPK